MTRERVIAELEAAIELARQKGDPMAMIRGWAEIGRLTGAYSPERRKVEISLDGERLQAQMATMSGAELFKLAELPTR